MDSGEGRMIKCDPVNEQELREQYPKSKGIFTQGEELEIKGSRFKVWKITPFGIKLKLLRS